MATEDVENFWKDVKAPSEPGPPPPPPIVRTTTAEARIMFALVEMGHVVRKPLVLDKFDEKAPTISIKFVTPTENEMLNGSADPQKMKVVVEVKAFVLDQTIRKTGVTVEDAMGQVVEEILHRINALVAHREKESKNYKSLAQNLDREVEVLTRIQSRIGEYKV